MLLFKLFQLAILNVIFGVARLNYVPGTPTGLSGMGAVGLRRLMWDKKLREDSIRPSVFTVLETAIRVVGDEIVVDKAGVFMKVEAEPGAGQSVRLAMAEPLQKAPAYGTSNHILGNEDERTLLWTELFYNEIKKAIKYKAFGYDFNDTAYLKFVESYGPALTTFMQELRDVRCHQALVLRFAEELINDPLSATCVQTLNPNWFLPGLDDSSFPAWEVTYNTTRTDGAADSNGYYSSRVYSGSTSFAENVGTSLIAASGTGSTPKNLFNVDAAFALSEYLPAVQRIDPVMLDGIPSYILLVPTRVKAWMLNPNRSGSMGEYFEAVASYIDKDRIEIPGEIGRICKNLVIVEDYRSVTLTVGGSAGSYTLTPGFVNPGNNDDRNNAAWSNTSGSTNFVYDLIIVLGANALAEYLVDPLITNLKESTEYGQIQGRGAYLGEGIQLPFFDKDAASRLDGSNKTLVYRGSLIVPVGRVARMSG